MDNEQYTLKRQKRNVYACNDASAPVGRVASVLHNPRVPLRSALGYALLGFQPVLNRTYPHPSQRLQTVSLGAGFAYSFNATASISRLVLNDGLRDTE